jgi:small subunit ribosomal protein S17
VSTNKVGRKEIVGIVDSDKMDKSIVVVVQRLVKHKMYGKYIRRSTRCVAHDENGEAHVGDTVRLAETRPMSARKRWRLLEVIKRA